VDAAVAEGYGIVNDGNYLYILAGVDPIDYDKLEWSYLGIVKINLNALSITAYRTIVVNGAHFIFPHRGKVLTYDGTYMYLTLTLVNTTSGDKDVLIGKVDPSSLDIEWLKVWGTDGQEDGTALLIDRDRVLVIGNASTTIGTLSDVTFTGIYVVYTINIVTPSYVLENTLTPTNLPYTEKEITLDPGGTEAVVISLDTLGNPLPIPEHTLIAIAVLTASLIFFAIKRLRK